MLLIIVMPETSLASVQVMEPELMAGESILWAGQPSASVIFHRTDIQGIPFSLLWGGFAIFWEISVTGRSPHGSYNLPLILWGIPFVVMGQYIIWGRFLHSAWEKNHTFYALTNKRVLVVRTAFSRKVTEGILGDRLR